MLALLAGTVTPRWLDDSLAGYAFTYDETHKPFGLRDPKSGFMLVRGVECDGGLLTLLLTRDRHQVVGEGFKIPGIRSAEGYEGEMPVVSKTLRTLRTGKGLAIGDSPDALRTRLGRPTRLKRHGPFVNYVYAARLGQYDPWSKGVVRAEIEQRYTFKAGRLIEIRFFRDSTP